MPTQPTACPVQSACQVWWASLPNNTNIAIGLSGGLDSTVLLHALAHTRPLDQNGLVVLHIHHGLSANADAWQTHCEQQAKQFGLTFLTERVVVDSAEQGVEAAARQQRYQALTRLCQTHDLHHLAVAHHADDQAETLLLQLLRGTGLRGLMSMPAKRDLTYKLTLHRPFLPLTRTTLNDYCIKHSLSHIDDESNQDPHFTRNALRLKVMPVLKEIEVAAVHTISRSAKHLAEAQSLLDELAREDLLTLSSPEETHPTSLSLPALLQLSTARQRNVVRYWLRHLHIQGLPEARLNTFLEQLSPSSLASIQLGKYGSLRCWRERIFLQSNLHLATIPQQIFSQRWQGESEWTLPDWQGILRFEELDGRNALTRSQNTIAKSVLLNQIIEARPRVGGERLQLHANQVSHSLKNLFQEKAIPPWERHVPIFWCETNQVAPTEQKFSKDTLQNSNSVRAEPVEALLGLALPFDKCSAERGRSIRANGVMQRFPKQLLFVPKLGTAAWAHANANETQIALTWQANSI